MNDWIDTLIDEMDGDGGHDHFRTSREAVRAVIAEALAEARKGKTPAPPVTPPRTIVAIDPGDPEGAAIFATEDEHGVSLIASAGWVTPTDIVSDFLQRGHLEIPEIKVTRGGIIPSLVPDPKATVVPDVALPPQKRLHFGYGHWEYGIDVADYGDGDTEPDIVSSEFIFEHSPFLSIGDVLESDHYEEGCKVYKRWVPDRGPWKDAEK